MQADSITLTPDLEQRIRGLGLEFLARFLELETRRKPTNVDALAELGHVYTHQGLHDKGLAVDRKLVRLVPDNPTVHYNLACSLSILGHRDEALESLASAIELGYDDADFMRRDEDLRNVWSEDGFRRLIDRIRQA